MSSESVCQIAYSWVDMGSFHTRLFGVMYFTIASVQEFLDTPPYSLTPRTDLEMWLAQEVVPVCQKLGGLAQLSCQ
jgi:hypothetical protein